jgi:predicted nucleic acid-binding protein
MIRTYVDAGILITAARGVAPIALKAIEILDDPNREFACSIFLKLEILPKAIYHKNRAEAAFYNTFFNAVDRWADSLDVIAGEAFREACNSGLAAMDALHVASAVSVGAEELVTTERAEKPIHRTRLIKVVSIFPERV